MYFGCLFELGSYGVLGGCKYGCGVVLSDGMGAFVGAGVGVAE